MPRYRIETKNGTYDVEASDDSQLEAVVRELQGSAAAPKSPQEHEVGMGEMIGRGMTGGLQDYAAAGGKYIGDKLGGVILKAAGKDATLNGRTYGNLSYEDALRQVRGANAQYREENPVKAYGGEIVGGIASPLFRGVAKATDAGLTSAAQFLGKTVPRYLGYGAQGATSGLVAGLGNAQNEQGGLPSVRDLAEQGGASTVFGAGLGVAVPAAAEGGRWLVNKVAQPVIDRIAASGPVNAASRKTLEALEARGMTPQQLMAKMRARGGDGQAMIADVLPELAEDAAQVRGPAQIAAQRGLTSRQGTIMSPSGQGDRLADSVFKNLSSENFGETVDDLVRARSAEAGPKYKAAFDWDAGENYKAIKSDLVQRLMDRPIFQQGLRKGITDVMDEAAITGDDISAFKTYIEGADLNDPNVVLKKVPTLRVLDAAKRGLDSILQGGGEEIRHPITGRLTQRGMRVEQMREALVSELDNLTTNPKTGESFYKAARDAWAGPSRSIDMMARGRQFVRDGGAEETQAFINKMSESEKEFYRIGVAKQLREMIESAGDEANKAKKIFGTETMRKKLEAIFPTRKAFNEFRKSILIEMERANTKQTVIGNSASARRLIGQEQAQLDPTGPAIDLATGNVRGGTIGLLRQGVRALNAPSASTAAELAPLFSRDQAVQQQFIQDLSNRALASRLLGQRPLGRVSPAFGSASGLITGSSNQ